MVQEAVADDNREVRCIDDNNDIPAVVEVVVAVVVDRSNKAVEPGDNNTVAVDLINLKTAIDDSIVAVMHYQL